MAKTRGKAAASSGSKAAPTSRKGASTSKRARTEPQNDYLGCDLDDTEQARWDNLVLPKRDILVTKFFDRETLQSLGLLESVGTFLERGGLHGFLDKNAPTFRRITLEFLATLRVFTEEAPWTVVFRLFNKEYRMSFSTLAEVFGVVRRDEIAESELAATEGNQLAQFWHDITGQTIAKGTEKPSRIPHPGLRLISRVLSMCFLGFGESTHLTRPGLLVLYNMSPEVVAREVWVAKFLRSCTATRRAKAGKIAFGGMVTLVALHLGIDLSTEVKVEGSHLLTIGSLLNMKLLALLATGEAYALLVGTQQKVPYLRLPRPQGVAIPVGPTNKDLYLPPDPVPQLGIVEEEDDDDDEDAAEEGDDDEEMGDAEASESSQPRGSVSDAYRRVAMEENMEELRDELGHIRDQHLELLALQRSISDMYARLHPDVYHPPSQAVYDGIAQRNLAREARAAEQSRKARSRSCFGSCFGSTPP